MNVDLELFHREFKQHMNRYWRQGVFDETFELVDDTDYRWGRSIEYRIMDTLSMDDLKRLVAFAELRNISFSLKPEDAETTWPILSWFVDSYQLDFFTAKLLDKQ